MKYRITFSVFLCLIFGLCSDLFVRLGWSGGDRLNINFPLYLSNEPIIYYMKGNFTGKETKLLPISNNNLAFKNTNIKCNAQRIRTFTPQSLKYILLSIIPELSLKSSRQYRIVYPKPALTVWFSSFIKFYTRPTRTYLSTFIKLVILNLTTSLAGYRFKSFKFYGETVGKICAVSTLGNGAKIKLEFRKLHVLVLYYWLV